MFNFSRADLFGYSRIFKCQQRLHYEFLLFSMVKVQHLYIVLELPL